MLMLRINREDRRCFLFISDQTEFEKILTGRCINKIKRTCLIGRFSSDDSVVNLLMENDIHKLNGTICCLVYD